MDEYEYKLSTNNPALIAKTISALVEAIRKSKKNQTDVLQRELKYLKEKCACGHAIISTTAGLGHIELVRSNTLQISHTMADLVSMIPLAKNLSGIVLAITELLIMDLEAKLAEKNEYKCPFNLATPQHPLVSVLLQNQNAWEDVLNCTARFYNVKDVAIIPSLDELFRPLFLYILCDPFLKMPQLCCMKFLRFIADREQCDSNLLLRVISWLQISPHKNLSFAADVISDLMTSHLASCDEEFQEFLILWLAAILHELCLAEENITQIVAYISKKISESKLNNCGNILLVIFTNCLRVASATHFEDLLLLCRQLLKKNSLNMFTLLTLKACLLNWSIHPSFITERTSGIIGDVYDCIENADNVSNCAALLKTNHYISAYQNTNQNVHLAVEICTLFDAWKTNNDLILRFLTDCEFERVPLPGHLQLILYAIFLHEGNENAFALSALNLMVKSVTVNTKLTNHVLTLILHRLSNPALPPCFQLRLLKALPKMCGAKENLQLVISTLKAVSGSSSSLRTLGMSLFYELWLVEGRSYPYLQSLLMESGDEEFNVTKAHVLKELCAKRSELYGTELAAHLSKILNQCKNDSGAASALALEGLRHLCNKGVIDIATAWTTLAKTFNVENRTLVVKSFCDLLSEVPILCADSDDKYKQTISEIVEKLWWYTTNSCDVDVIRSAYRALSAFSLAEISAEFPDIYQGVVRVNNEKPSVFNNYELVPGKWWLLVLQNGNRVAITYAAEFIISLASKEVAEYGRGIYNAPTNRGEPHNYNALQESSIIRAIASYMKQQTRECENEVDVMCLKILAHEYCKPLPPFDWCFLQELVHHPEFRSYCIDLASKQVVLSGTARRFIENFIVAVTYDASNLDDILCILKNLKHLCNSIQPSIIKPLLENSFRYAHAQIDNQHDRSLLNELILHVKEVLKKEDLHEANKNVLAQVIAKNLQNAHFFNDLLECVPLLPHRYVKECISQSTFEKEVKIRCMLATNSSALVWLNDIIDSARTDLTPTQQQRDYILKEIAEVLRAVEDNNDGVPDWMLELIGQIQIKLAEGDAFTERIAFMCDVLMTAVIVLSGHRVLLKYQSRKKLLFAQALKSLLLQEKWQTYVSQILDWLYHLINLEKIPQDYEIAFYQALIALRHQASFKESFRWMKFIGCKRKHCL